MHKAGARAYTVALRCAFYTVLRKPLRTCCITLMALVLHLAWRTVGAQTERMAAQTALRKALYSAIPIAVSIPDAMLGCASYALRIHMPFFMLRPAALRMAVRMGLHPSRPMFIRISAGQAPYMNQSSSRSQ